EPQAYRPRLGANDQLLLSAWRENHRRRIASDILKRAPERLPVSLVQAGYRLPVARSRQHDQFVVHDDRRSGHTISRNGRVVVRQNIQRPTHFPGPSIQPPNLPQRPKRINFSVIIGRRRARTFPAEGFLESRLPAVSPDFSPALDFIRDDY